MSGTTGAGLDAPAAASPRLVASWVLCVLMVLMLLLCCLLLASGTVVHFEAIFRDLNIRLPLVTGWVIGFARWHGEILLLAVAGGGVWLQTAHAGRTWKIVADALGLVMAMALLAVITAALFAPLVGIVQQLDGRPGP